MKILWESLLQSECRSVSLCLSLSHTHTQCFLLIYTVPSSHHGSHSVKYAVECCCVESSNCTGPKCDANRKRMDHLENTKHLLWWFIKTEKLHNGMLIHSAPGSPWDSTFGLLSGFYHGGPKSSTDCNLKKKAGNFPHFSSSQQIVQQSMCRFKPEVNVFSNKYCVCI